MNERIGLAPRCFQDARELKYILERLGPYEGRFAADFPSAWKRAALEYAEDLGQVEFARIRELLVRHHRSGFIACGLVYSPVDSWTTNARRVQAGANQFALVVADLKEPSEFPRLADVELDSLPGSRDWRGQATAENYAALAEPYINATPVLSIVDPHFSIERDSDFRVVQSLVSRLSSPRCCRLLIFSRMDSSVRGADKRLRERAKRILDSTKALREGIDFYFLSDLADKRQHARYLIGSHGALRFDAGFRHFSDGRLADVSVVDRKLHTDLYGEFVERTGTLPSVHSLKVSS